MGSALKTSVGVDGELGLGDHMEFSLFWLWQNPQMTVSNRAGSVDVEVGGRHQPLCRGDGLRPLKRRVTEEQHYINAACRLPAAIGIRSGLPLGHGHTTCLNYTTHHGSQTTSSVHGGYRFPLNFVKSNFH